MKVVALAVCLALLIVSPVAVAQPAPWISQSFATQYVDNLITSYNAGITSYYGTHPNNTVLDAFPLYQGIGYSFNVTVMRMSNTSTAFIGFVFVPILGSKPLIAIDNNDTIDCLFYYCLNFLDHFKPTNDLGIEIVRGAYNGTSGAGIEPFVWIANATTMFGEGPLVGSAQAAQNLFQHDRKGIVTPPAPSLPDQIWSFVQTYIIVFVFGIFGFIVGVIYLYREGMLPHFKPASKGTRRPSVKRRKQ